MRTFCCIIPARLGVLVLAPLTGAAATICCFFALYALIHFFDDLVLGQKVFLGLLGSSMAIVGLASIFGFLGAIIASLKAVSFYSAVLTTIWLSALLTGIINFVFLWKDRNYFVKSCAATNKDQIVGDVNDWCNGRFLLGFGFMVAFWGAVSLLSLYLISIVRRYGKQLSEQHYSPANQNV